MKLFDDYAEERDYHGLSKEPSCKHCGKSNLRWDSETRTMMEGLYKVHKCDPKLVHAQVAGDFEDLTK